MGFNKGGGVRWTLHSKGGVSTVQERLHAAQTPLDHLGLSLSVVTVTVGVVLVRQKRGACNGSSDGR